jgi:hypothetical protein
MDTHCIDFLPPRSSPALQLRNDGEENYRQVTIERRQLSESTKLQVVELGRLEIFCA